MPSRLSLFAWLTVPLAAAAGYYGGSAGSGHTGAALSGKAGPAAGSGPSAQRPAAGSSVPGGWLPRLEQCTVAELPGLYAEINALPDGEDKQTVLRLLYARWADLDAPGGVTFFFAESENGTKTSWGLIRVLTEWAVKDPVRAYEAALTAGGEKPDDIVSNVGSELLREDPGQFWIWFQKAKLPIPYWEDDAWKPVIAAHFEEMAAVAAEKLAAESAKTAGESRPGTMTGGLYKMLAGVLAEKDPAAAVEWAKNVPETVRNQALAGALSVLAVQDPNKLAEHLTLMKSRQTGANSFEGSGAGEIVKLAVNTIAERDPLEALQWVTANQAKLESMRDFDGISAATNALASALREGRLTPEQAFTAVREMKDDSRSIRYNMFLSMWGGLSADQLASAAEWMRTVDSKSSRPLAMQGIFQEWYRKDPAAAEKFAATLNEPDLVKDMYAVMTRNAGTGPYNTMGERMAAVIGKVPAEYRAEALYEQVRMNYAGHMMDHRPSFEGALFAATLEGVPASETKTRAAAMLAQTWGGTDPVAALAWSGSQTDPAFRAKTSGAVVEAWAKEDAWGASAWIKEQPPGETRDTAAHHLARVLRTEEPESAWAWAMDIGDPATRVEAQAAVLRQWRDSSESAARAAVEALGQNLPADQRQKLVDTLERRDAAK